MLFHTKFFSTWWIDIGLNEALLSMKQFFQQITHGAKRIMFMFSQDREHSRETFFFFDDESDFNAQNFGVGKEINE